MSESGGYPPPSLSVGLQVGLQRPRPACPVPSAARSGAAPDDAGRPHGTRGSASCPSKTLSPRAGCW
jgi:hypothetical protein